MTTLARARTAPPAQGAPGASVVMLSFGGRVFDRRITAQANALAASGRTVTLLSAPFDRAAAGLDPRVTVETGPDELGGIESRLGLARRLPAPVFESAKRAWYRVRGGPARGIADYLASMPLPERVDAIHCHDLDTLAAGVRLRDLRPGARLIYDAHELYPHQVRSSLHRSYWTRVETALIHEADAVITVSPSFADQFVRLYGVARPTVVYNACEPSEPLSTDPRGRFARCFGLSDDDPRTRVVFQGSQSPDRGLGHLVDAFKALGDRFVLCMLGEGPEHAELVTRAGPSVGIRFASTVPQAQLPGLLRGADLGVIPYPDLGLLNNRYCSPNKLFEFIDAGLPVCANDLPEVRRVLDTYAIGLSAPMTDAATAATAIERAGTMLSQGAFPPEGFARARAELGWDRQRRTLLGLYESHGV